MRREVSVVIGMGGMGRVIARRIGPGTELLIADYGMEAVEAVAGQMRGDGFSVHVHEVDVRSAKSVAAVATAASALGKLTRVVSTAGVSPVQGPIETILSVNLLGAAHVIEAFGEVIIPGGAAVVIASNAGYLFSDSLDPQEMRALATMPAAALAELPAVQPTRFSDRARAYGFAKHICRLRVQAAAAGQREMRGSTRSARVSSRPRWAVPSWSAATRRWCRD